VCNTIQLSEICDFRVSTFYQVVQKHKSGILKRLLIAYIISNICAKKYQNPFMCVKVTASQRWDFFETRCSGLFFIDSQCILWPNGWMDEDVTWYGGRPRPRPLCVRRGPNPSPRERGTTAPLFLAHVYCGHGRPSQLLLK